MPSASASTAMAVKAGDLSSVRMACFMGTGLIGWNGDAAGKASGFFRGGRGRGGFADRGEIPCAFDFPVAHFVDAERTLRAARAVLRRPDRAFAKRNIGAGLRDVGDFRADVRQALEVIDEPFPDCFAAVA